MICLMHGLAKHCIHKLVMKIRSYCEGRTRAVVMSDPCVSSRWWYCELASQHAFGMTVEMTNLIFDRGGVDALFLLGDNFYDADGVDTARFWSALSLNTQAALFGVVPWPSNKS